jgi:recombination protein RecR
MASYTKAIERLTEQFARLPGIGARTAERLAFHILKSTTDEAMALADAIRDVKTKVRPCTICFNLAEQEVCDICADERRDRATICVVEQPKDLLSLESTGQYNGVYHVLMGVVAPLEGVEPEDLTIDALVQRVASGGVREVILATNPTVAGDTTALHVIESLKPTGVEVTRLARGLPAGGSIEYANKSILADALNERRKL